MNGRLWRLEYRVGGREKLVSLGAYPDVGLKRAGRSGVKLRPSVHWVDASFRQGRNQQTFRLGRIVHSSNQVFVPRIFP